jgi:RNA polymerase primary sigma factor
VSQSEIKFIPNADFATASEQDFEDVDVKLYAAEEGRCAPVDRNEAASTFMQAIEESRILTFEGEQFLFKRLNFLRFRANAIRITLSAKPPKRTLKEIARLLQGAQEAREDIARANIRLVASIARRLSSTSDNFDEYVSEANGILLNAIDKFDFSRGYRFSTYATHAIQRHLYRYIGRTSKRSSREKLVSDSVEAVAVDSSDDTGPSAADVLIAAEAVLDQLDDVLDERERLIIRGRFGLNEAGHTSTLRELGAELGLSKERVRQLQLFALEKLAEVARPFESSFTPHP